MIALGFVLAAAAGAVGRHLVVARIGQGGPDRGPLGVLAVNIVGSGVLGVLVGLRLDGTLSAGTVTVLGTGLCGALTTWSGFAIDAVGLLDRDDRRRAAAYVGASLVLGLTAAGIGLVATGAI